MDKDFYFRFYFKEWLVSTAGWDADIRGWYVNLLAHQADKGCLPSDIESLAELAGVKFSQYNRFTECFKHTLEHKFKAMEDGSLVNEKMMKLNNERKQYREKQSKRGTVGALIKKGKELYPQFERWDLVSKALMSISNIEQMNIDEKESCLKHTLEAFNECDYEYDYEDKDENDGKNLKEKKSENSEVEIYPSFDDFWNEYDKKVGKKDKIKKKWEKLSQKTKEDIMGYIPKYKISQPNKQYRKNPETFLNNESWNDEIISNGEKKSNNSQESTGTIYSEDFYRKHTSRFGSGSSE